MNKINVADILSQIRYVAILRMSPTFPNYKAGSDIDFLCLDVIATGTKLKSLMPLVQHDKETGHIHLDSMVGGKIGLRFDMYTTVISLDFTIGLISSVRMITIVGVDYWVPSEEFDGMLKCDEYLKFPKRKAKYKSFLNYKDQLDAYKV